MRACVFLDVDVGVRIAFDIECEIAFGIDCDIDFDIVFDVGIGIPLCARLEKSSCMPGKQRRFF